MNIKIPEKRIVGAKQSLRAIKSGTAKMVYIAENAETKVTRPIIEACDQFKVELVRVDTMQKLGVLCGIDVGAAAACVLKE
jgi:large subunit ribosomal protein L7A